MSRWPRLPILGACSMAAKFREKREVTMKLIATKLSSSERWCNEVRQRAWRTQQLLTSDEKRVVEMAYDSYNEEAWRVADLLLQAIDLPVGKHHVRSLAHKELEILCYGQRNN